MKATLTTNSLKKIVDGTKRFVASNDNSPLMQYIHIVVDAEKQEIKAEALDGHRFSIEHAELTECDESFDCFIKPAIPKITKFNYYAEIELVNGKAYVTVGDSIIGYKQPEGKYFELSKIIADTEKVEPKAKIAVQSKLLADALTSITVPKDYRNTAKIEIREPQQVIIIRSGENDIKGVLPIRVAEWG